MLIHLIERKTAVPDVERIAAAVPVKDGLILELGQQIFFFRPRQLDIKTVPDRRITG